MSIRIASFGAMSLLAASFSTPARSDNLTAFGIGLGVVGTLTHSLGQQRLHACPYGYGLWQAPGHRPQCIPLVQYQQQYYGQPAIAVPNTNTYGTTAANPPVTTTYGTSGYHPGTKRFIRCRRKWDDGHVDYPEIPEDQCH